HPRADRASRVQELAKLHEWDRLSQTRPVSQSKVENQIACRSPYRSHRGRRVLFENTTAAPGRRRRAHPEYLPLGIHGARPQTTLPKRYAAHVEVCPSESRQSRSGQATRGYSG